MEQHEERNERAQRSCRVPLVVLLKVEKRQVAIDTTPVAFFLDDRIPARREGGRRYGITDRLAADPKGFGQFITPNRATYFLNLGHSTSRNTLIMYRKGSFLSNIHFSCTD